MSDIQRRESPQPSSLLLTNFYPFMSTLTHTLFLKDIVEPTGFLGNVSSPSVSTPSVSPKNGAWFRFSTSSSLWISVSCLSLPLCVSVSSSTFLPLSPCWSLSSLVSLCVTHIRACHCTCPSVSLCADCPLFLSESLSLTSLCLHPCVTVSWVKCVPLCLYTWV